MKYKSAYHLPPFSISQSPSILMNQNGQNNGNSFLFHYFPPQISVGPEGILRRNNAVTRFGSIVKEPVDVIPYMEIISYCLRWLKK